MTLCRTFSGYAFVTAYSIVRLTPDEVAHYFDLGVNERLMAEHFVELYAKDEYRNGR